MTDKEAARQLLEMASVESRAAWGLTIYTEALLAGAAALEREALWGREKGYNRFEYYRMGHEAAKDELADLRNVVHVGKGQYELALRSLEELRQDIEQLRYERDLALAEKDILARDLWDMWKKHESEAIAVAKARVGPGPCACKECGLHVNTMGPFLCLACSGGFHQGVKP